MTVADGTSVPDGAEQPVEPGAGDRSALAVFLVASLAAVPFLLWAGRDQWFFLDEWWLLTDRDLRSVDGLLADHNGHWVSLPVVLYRGLYGMFGLREYLPYQLLSVLSHVAIAVLMRTTMRRAGASSWIATGFAGCFLVLGSGATNILWGFQVGMNSSLLLGYVALLTATTSPTGSRRGRDLVALLALTIGLATSGVMIAMVAGVSFAVLVVRGPRAAFVHAAVPGVLYVVWFSVFADDGPPRGGVADTTDFALRLSRAGMDGMGRSGLATIVLGLTIAFGLWETGRRRATDPRAAGLVGGLVVAWVGFVALTAFGRAGLLHLTPNAPQEERYVHVCVALLLPLVAVGATWLWTRHPALVAGPVLALAFGVPGNVEQLFDRSPIVLGREEYVQAMANSVAFDSLDDDDPVGRPDDPLSEFGPMTVGWLRDAVRSGRLETSDAVPAARVLEAEIGLGFDQVHGSPPSCATAATSAEVGPDDVLAFGGAIDVVVADDGARSGAVRFDAANGNRIVVRTGPWTVELAPSAGSDTDDRACLEPAAGAGS